jgi:voltage-gated potassium channel
MKPASIGLTDLRRARPVIVGLARQLAVVAVLLVLCGTGFWMLEPTTPRLVDGLWLAFVTASTIGYGDFVPTTWASRARAVPVLLLGFAALSLVTAAIAAMWVGSQERAIEREILHDLHAQVRLLRNEIEALREDRAEPAPASKRQPM